MSCQYLSVSCQGLCPVSICLHPVSICLCRQCLCIVSICLCRQGLFVFCLPWSVGSLLTSESRREFDVLLRDILLGSNKDHPKPKSFKLGKG